MWTHIFFIPCVQHEYSVYQYFVFSCTHGLSGPNVHNLYAKNIITMCSYLTAWSNNHLAHIYYQYQAFNLNTQLEHTLHLYLLFNLIQYNRVKISDFPLSLSYIHNMCSPWMHITSSLFNDPETYSSSIPGIQPERTFYPFLVFILITHFNYTRYLSWAHKFIHTTWTTWTHSPFIPCFLCVNLQFIHTMSST